MKRKATKRHPTKQNIKLALAKLKQIDFLKEKIADLKDQLRAKISDVEDICNYLDDGEMQIESGLDNLRSGLETMSQML